MYINSITSKGQITLPKEFRDKLGLEKTRRAQIRLNKNNEIVITAQPSEAELRTSLAKPGRTEELLSDYDRQRGEELLQKYGIR